MTRALTQAEKKAISITVGNDLAKTHGKKKYYTQPQIKRSLDKNGYGLDIDCWAYCLFMDHISFDNYHREIGESCDYLEMKQSMVSSLTDNASESWFDVDFDMSWLELPDIDFSAIFDVFDI